MSVTFQSVLDDIGNFMKKVFDVVVPVAEAAEPIINVALPGIGVLYTATVNAVAVVEAAAVTAGKQTGTGVQKLAAVVNIIEADYNAFAAQNKLPTATTNTIEQWVNSVVAGLNALPAAVTATTDKGTSTVSAATLTSNAPVTGAAVNTGK